MTLQDGARSALGRLDRHPILAVVGVSGLVFAGLTAWSLLSDSPTLLGRASADTRADLYGQLAGSAVAMLAVALTVLAIMLSLPDRERIKELRDSGAWMLVLWILLTAAAFSVLTLVLAHVASGVDVAQEGKEWLEHLVLSAGVGALLAFLIGGAAFALVIKASHEPSNRTRGRGEGPA